MFQLLAKKLSAPNRLTAAVLLLAIFALPLHFHFFTPTAKLNQECSCYQGARTQAVLAPAQADWIPAFQASFIDLDQPQVFGRLSFDSHAIRAPPHSISL
ncbi:MAG: hypothetical protein ACREQP_07765 [Candidatus Binatia bacterium]